MQPTRSDTRREYIARINRVLDYIREHLDEDLPLQKLAEVAAFSPFHFHRVFQAMVGESINEYVNRLRVERAGSLLRNRPRESITEICLECGFSSPSNFARAFKRHFGVSASEFRKISRNGFSEVETQAFAEKSKIGEAIRNPGKAESNQREASDLLPEYTSMSLHLNPNQKRRIEKMDVEVKNLQSYRVAYVRVMDGYNSEKIRPAFEKVMTWARARDLIGPESLILGVGLDDPRVTPKEKCRYDACVTVPPGTRGEGEVGVYDMPGGKYALYRIEGDYSKINEQLEKAWLDLMAGWFPDSGYQPDDRPCFEIYRETEEEMKAGKYIVDLCESLKPL